MYNPDVECDKLVKNIKALLKLKSMSVNMVAKKAGMSTSALNELMNGRTKPQLYTLFRLCNALEVTMDELFWNVGCSETTETNVDEEYDSTVSLNAKERDLLFSYRNLPEFKKEMLKVYTEMLISYEAGVEG